MVLTKAMGILPASFRVRLSILAAVLVGAFMVPSMASAACTLPTTPVGTGHTLDQYVNPADSTVYSGNFKPDMRKKSVLIPFDVPAGASGIRIRYCYDGAGTTLDLGLFEPNQADPGNFTIAQQLSLIHI